MTPLLQTTAKAQSFRPGGAMAEWISADPARARRVAETINDGRSPEAPRVSNAGTVVSSDIDGMNALFAPMPTSSGYPVTDYTATLVTTVFACLSKIGGAVLQLPCHEYLLSISGERERAPLSKMWWLLNEQPCANWTAASWKEWIVNCVHLRGDQHTEILRSGNNSGGAPIGLRPHHPDCVSARYYLLDDEVRLAYDVYDPWRGRAYTLDQDDMLHFSGYGFDGRSSISVLQHAARNAIGNSLAASDYSGKSIGQGAMPKIALTYPNKLAEDQKNLLRASFVATYGAGPTQQRLPLILTEGGTAAPLSISPVDMELLDSRKLESHQICEAMGVPPIMIGDSEKTSSWGTGVEQITLGFVKFTLQPHLCRWEEELNRKLFRRAGRFVEFELDALLRGDSKAQAEAFRLSLGGPGSGPGWMSVNEIRKLKNQPRVDGPEYDKPFMPAPDAKGATPAPKEPA
jgi:HK97 family phage portal protein